MMPSAKIDRRSSAPPENMLNMLRIVPDCAWKNWSSATGVDSRYGNERTDPVNDQRAHEKREPLAQLAEARGIAQHLRRIAACSGHGYSTLPPAASMIFLAPGVTAIPTTLTGASSVPEAKIFARLACFGTRCAALSAARSTL